MEIQRELPPRPRFRRRSRGALYLACAYWSLAFVGYPAFSQPVHRNLWGNTGMIDMPSARMAEDGLLTVGANLTKNTQRYNFSFQALPWLETAFNYTGLEDFDPTYPVYFDRNFAVKARLIQEGAWMPAIAVGVRDLVGTGIYSGEYVVASKRLGDVDVTFGMGWGRLGSTNFLQNPLTLISKKFETRRVFPNTQPGDTAANILFHSPKVGLFGGITWDTPINGLALIVEYSNDKNTLESQRGTFKNRNQLNLGATYEISNTLSAGASWLYGESMNAQFSFTINPVRNPHPEGMGPEMPIASVRAAEAQFTALEKMQNRGSATAPLPALTSSAMVDALWQSHPDILDVGIRGQNLLLTVSDANLQPRCARIADIISRLGRDFTTVALSNGRQEASCAVKTQFAEPNLIRVNASDTMPAANVTLPPMVTIDARKAPPPDTAAIVAKWRREMSAQQIGIDALQINGFVATVMYENNKYATEIDALRRLITLAMADAPPDVEEFRFVKIQSGVPQREFRVARAALERSLEQTTDIEMETQLEAQGAAMQYPGLRTEVLRSYPRFDWTVSPQFRQQLFDPNNPFGVQILAAAQASVTLFSGFSISTQAEASIYDNFLTNRPSDSVLPHVRTDFIRYFSEGKNGIRNLEASYKFRLSPNTFATLRAGYLESMFAGVGGEILWRPEGARWALGADLYSVKQRDYDRLFGFQNYNALTGHVTLYYASPWYNLNFLLSAGRYLAGDQGITVQATRRFASGIEVGAFFTKTNVSSAQFGEGSFDKGIIIRMPLGFTLPTNTQNEFGMIIKPVQRDGGQKLDGGSMLYEETRRASRAEMEIVSGR